MNMKYFFVQEWFVSNGKGDCLSALLGRHHKVLHQTDWGLKSVALKYKKYPLDNPVPCCCASKPLRRPLRSHPTWRCPSKPLRRPLRSHPTWRRPSKPHGAAPRNPMAPRLETPAPRLETPWRCASKPQVRHASKPLGTNFETNPQKTNAQKPNFWRRNFTQFHNSFGVGRKPIGESPKNFAPFAPT